MATAPVVLGGGGGGGDSSLATVIGFADWLNVLTAGVADDSFISCFSVDGSGCSADRMGCSTLAFSISLGASLTSTVSVEMTH